MSLASRRSRPSDHTAAITDDTACRFRRLGLHRFSSRSRRPSHHSLPWTGHKLSPACNHPWHSPDRRSPYSCNHRPRSNHNPPHRRHRGNCRPRLWLLRLPMCMRSYHRRKHHSLHSCNRCPRSNRNSLHRHHRGSCRQRPTVRRNWAGD